MPSPTPPTRGRAREDTGERLSHPARPAHIPTPALRISHFPDPPPTTLEPHSPPRLDTEGSHDRMPAGARRRALRCRVTTKVGIRSFADAGSGRARPSGDRRGGAPLG